MLEWYGYFPTSYATVSTADVRMSLPQSIQEELIQTPGVFQGLVAVEARKKDVIAELDMLLLVESPTDFLKQRSVEIRKSEIAKFRYFRVVPMDLAGDDVDFELDVPQCSKCLWGIHVRPPIKLSGKIQRTCDVGEIVRPLKWTPLFGPRA